MYKPNSSLVFIHAELNMPCLTVIYRLMFPEVLVEIGGPTKSLYALQEQQREKKERLKREIFFENNTTDSYAFETAVNRKKCLGEKTKTVLQTHIEMFTI